MAGLDALVREIGEAFGGLVLPEEIGPVEAQIEPWSALDASQFRGLLPVAMIRVLNGANGRGLRWWLNLPLSGDEEIYLRKWALLDHSQRAAVARFLAFMADATRAAGEDGEASLWEEAYESYWDTLP